MKDYEYILECKNLTKKFNKKLALDSISLKLPKGSIVGLLGPNGSGKTTLLKLASGLLTPSNGEILIKGQKVNQDTKMVTSYQGDKPFLNDWMTVEDMMKMMNDFFSNFNLNKAYTMLKNLDIDLKDRIKTLSKGTKEKVQLITTMSREAELYLLDEPIGGVDPASRDYIINTIINNYNENATIVISTHLISEIEPILNHAIFLNKGVIVRQGDVEDIREENGKSLDALFREEFKC